MNQEDIVATIIKLSFVALLITVTAAMFYTSIDTTKDTVCIHKEKINE